MFSQSCSRNKMPRRVSSACRDAFWCHRLFLIHHVGHGVISHEHCDQVRMFYCFSLIYLVSFIQFGLPSNLGTNLRSVWDCQWYRGPDLHPCPRGCLIGYIFQSWRWAESSLQQLKSIYSKSASIAFLKRGFRFSLLPLKLIPSSDKKGMSSWRSIFVLQEDGTVNPPPDVHVWCVERISRTRNLWDLLFIRDTANSRGNLRIE